MIPTRLLPFTVTWKEPGTTTDRYDNTIDDWTTSTDTKIRAWIEQSGTDEHRDARDTVTSHWLLITNELGLTAKARIVWDGRIFAFDGSPSIQYTPRGAHHLEGRLLLVEG